jgi:hypothetical protein
MSEGTKFIQAVVSVLLGVLLIALMSKFTSQEATWALLLGAIAFFVTFATCLGTIALAAYDQHITAISDFVQSFANADDETRRAAGFAFPTMRYVMKRGIVRGELEDTGVPVEIFRLFLATSNDRYISPRRDWFTKDKSEADWIAIYQWLLEKDYIIADSAAGSVSWLWKGNAYRHLMAYWMAGRSPSNMNPTTVYAQDVENPALTTTPPPEEDA